MEFDIQTKKKPHETTIAVAMSGGVDSSVAAALLKQQNFNVIGLTLLLVSQESESDTIKEKSCCSNKDIYDARRVAQTIGIPHYVLNFEDVFKEKVIKQFCASYAKGETPIPCILCNQYIKYDSLLKTALELNCDYLVTGHYVRLEYNNNEFQLLKGLDPQKDQSYYLFSTPKEILPFLRFPIGSINKEQTRKIAQELNLPVAQKVESQDICFIPDGNYAKYVNNQIPANNTRGNFIHVNGKILGKHKGIIHYTVGQRKGLGIGGLQEPLYVVNINSKKNEVILGEHEHLLQHEVKLKNINWLIDKPLPNSVIKCEVKLRSVQPPTEAEIRVDKNSTVSVRLATGYYGVSPGQACVFYIGDLMIGGGWIV